MDVDRLIEVLEYSCPLAANLSEEKILPIAFVFSNRKNPRSYTRKFARWLIISKVVQIRE